MSCRMILEKCCDQAKGGGSLARNAPCSRCLQNKRPLLAHPLLRVCPSPLAFGLRPDPSWSANVCNINARSRHETPRYEIPARAGGMYLVMYMAFSCARYGVYFATAGARSCLLLAGARSCLLLALTLVKIVYPRGERNASTQGDPPKIRV